MTEHEGTENAELNTETGGIDLEDAEAKASADYQQRIEEFDNVESSTPITKVPNTGESGTVKMPKS